MLGLRHNYVQRSDPLNLLEILRHNPFVFGADARDGNRDRDVITDFNVAEDTILFEAGASIRFVEQRGDDVFIQLAGDRDSITVLNADIGIVANFEFANDLFLA